MRGVHHPLRTLAVVALAALTALAALPLVGAFHGASYTAEGTATSRTTGMVFDAEVSFSGESYTVILWEQETGVRQPVHWARYHAEETYTNIEILDEDEHDAAWCPGSLLVGDLHGRDAGALLVYSTAHSPILEISGPMRDCFATGAVFREMTGTYLDFDLDVKVCTLCPGGT